VIESHLEEDVGRHGREHAEVFLLPLYSCLGRRSPRFTCFLTLIGSISLHCAFPYEIVIGLSQTVATRLARTLRFVCLTAEVLKCACSFNILKPSMLRVCSVHRYRASVAWMVKVFGKEYTGAELEKPLQRMSI